MLSALIQSRLRYPAVRLAAQLVNRRSVHHGPLRDSGVIDIDATIYCEKASHKGIIIGKNGSMLKKISTEAREDCERFMGTKVFLQTWVKVKENWRDSQTMIRNFGYE